MTTERPRRVVVIAPRDYPAFDDEFRIALDEQVDVVVSWFGESTVESEACRLSILHPHSLDELEDLVRAEGLAGLHRDQPTVLYITGHGVQDSSRRHFLLLPGSEEANLRNTALVTADLVERVLSSSAEQILVFVDSCHSGALHAELAERLRSLPPDRRRLRTLAVITVGDFDEKPRVGEFATVLSRLYERFRSPQSGYARQYLSFQDLAVEMANLFQEENSLLEPLWVWPRSSPTPEATRCIPNPGYRPVGPPVEAVRRQLAQELSALPYWNSRASGRYSDEPGAWYFSGRRDELRTLCDFLGRGSGVVVVTGEAGSGKSAILAQVTVLSDPTFRNNSAFHEAVRGLGADAVPPLGSVDVALYARNATFIDLAAQLASCLAVEPPDAHADGTVLDAIVERLRSEDRTISIVIDGVDEAAQPELIVSGLLSRLLAVGNDAGEPLVRLIVGVRSDRPSGTVLRGEGLLDMLMKVAENVRPDAIWALIRTDSAADVVHDITEYVQRILLSGEDPGLLPVSRLRATFRSAELIAEEVSPSFLDARFAAARLKMAGGRPEESSAAFFGRLRAGTVSLLKADIQEESQRLDLAVDHVVAVLRAVAFSLGAGLPWANVWSTVAAALMPDTDTKAAAVDIDAVIAAVQRGRLSGYLASDVADDRLVYRPAHARIGEILRRNPELVVATLAGAPPVDDPSADRHGHAVVAMALLSLLGEGGAPQAPHAYVRRHLVRHAALGGVLSDTVVPPWFLPWESGGDVRRLLARAGNASDAAALEAWALVESLTDDADTASRASTLAFQLKAAGRSSELTSLRPMVTADWVRWRDDFTKVGNWGCPTWALATLTADDGQCVIAASGADGGIKLLDLDTGRELCPTLLGHVSRVRAFAQARREGVDVLLSGANDATVRIWQIATGHPVSMPLTGHQGPVTALTVVRLGDIDIVASGSEDGAVLLWDLTAGERFGDPLVASGPAIRALAGGWEDGEPVVVAGAADGTIRHWRVFEGPRPGVPIAAHTKPIRTMATAWSGGRNVIVSGSEDGTVAIWDLETGAPVGAPFTSHRAGIWSVSIVQRDGRPTVLSAGADREIRVWDLETRAELTPAWTSHERGVHVLAAALRYGQPVAVSASLDTTVRRWDAQNLREIEGPLLGSPDIINSIDVGTLAGRPVVVSAGSDASLQILNLDSGAVLHRIAVGHSRGVNGLSTRQHGASLLAVTGAEDGLVILTEALADGTATSRSFDGVGGPVNAVGIGFIQESLVVVSAYEDGAVRLWRAATGDLWCAPIRGHDGPVRALRVVERPGSTLIVTGGDDGVVCIWDAATATLTVPPLTGHDDWILDLATLDIGDRTVVVSGSDDRSIRLWDLDTGEPVGPPLRGHTGWVNAVAAGVVAGRPVIASASDAQDVRFWDVETSTELHRVVVGSPVLSMTFSPAPDGDTQMLLIGGIAGTARLRLDTDLFGSLAP
ncbi:AAA family ATPase [Dactylosporangium sp. NPDC050588]|uniref:AAA family ATPase n=1 Tax=Dactylosporangium sp. NPDC050588 TaxID=3157211 RepID=UPI0033FD1400